KSVEQVKEAPMITTKPMPLPPPPPQKKVVREPVRHRKVTEKLPLQLAGGTAWVNADIYHPSSPAAPKTIVLIAPASGNASRLGEVSGDGVNSYANSRNMSEEWAKSLANQGFFVVSYDKRTCQHSENPICGNVDQQDIDQMGIKALSADIDQACQFAVSKVRSFFEPIRLVLMSATQGAQAIALATCAGNASGIVLLSPIIGDLETMWVEGLNRAAEHAKSLYEKNQLLNRKESMVDFFTSLKAQKFPEHGHTRGASVKFWQTWLDASVNTLALLTKINKPTMFLISTKDDFNDTALLKSIGQKTSEKSNIRIKYYTDTDRNFITENAIPEKALLDVKTFIHHLPPMPESAY
ncbi:MAG TPA: alpha/beta hydrolase, partial [Myxococcota bacterium]|nr:alpha/beta hydrolase [Myxococcota bacterium]